MSAVLAPAACYHCGLPAPAASPWQVAIGGVPHSMCCPGCASVAQAIVDAGLDSYYETRERFAAGAKGAELVPPELALLDLDPRLHGQEGSALDAVFAIEGIRCAACVWLIEGRLARLPGVARADVNVATERLHLRWDPALCKASDIARAMQAIGYSVYPCFGARQEEQRERARKRLFRQLFVAGLCMMQVMMYALPAYIADEGTMDAAMAGLMRWASLLLTLPVLLYSAQPFFSGAWAGIRRRVPGMDLPVAIGIGAASVASIANTISGSGDVYFDSVTMFVFLLLASRYLEQQARHKAGRALEQLRHALPASALRLPAWPSDRTGEVVAAATLREGDVIMIASGAAVPADAVVLEGDALLDQSLLSGESCAVARAVGDQLSGGAVNLAHPVIARVACAASDSTLARLVTLVESAAAGKPRIVLWADRLAAWFVAGLLLLALVVLLVWLQIDPGRAWQVAIAVLVVSCPCALSLATPSALAAATGTLVEHGVLVVRPHLLETLHRATHVVFDKTGTLTEGRPTLRAIEVFGPMSEQGCLALAAALEAGSQHPFAAPLRAAGGSTLAAEGLLSVPGQGVEGVVDGMRLRLGRASFAAHAVAAPVACAPGASSIYLGCEGAILARFELADQLRPEAAEVVRRCRARGQQVILLSGDEQAIVDSVARELGVGEAHGGQLPDAKLAFVRQLQEGGAVVAMVGDGINDAAVLRAADASFAIGGGAALAQLNAGCVLVSGRLEAFADTADVAQRTLAIIGQNLRWAMVYNAVAIPAAAFGLVNPWLSAVGMSASSALVAMNALRLRRWKT